MDLAAFLECEAGMVAQQIQASGRSCWAVAMGGTRRAYLAEGGSFADAAGMEGYFRWAEATQRAVYEQLFTLGIETIILVGRIPADRGPAYAAFMRAIMQRLVCGDERRASYTRLQARVRIAGDIAQIARTVGVAELADEYNGIVAETAHASGPLLIYLFRGSWYDPASEEAQIGYQVGSRLQRIPTRDELVDAFYGGPVTALSAYVGSGRPRTGILRPPFVCGSEDLYWAHGPLMRLNEQDWRRMIFDHLYSRRTTGGRSYPEDDQARAALRTALEVQDGRVLGLGHTHPLGFWVAEP
ncbi:MAG: hypothetical protein SH847_21975 [Roseiflexaceae bacterium]|nr:hypothetical protein [Roseiflexaceae bacterium]